MQTRLTLRMLSNLDPCLISSEKEFKIILTLTILGDIIFFVVITNIILSKVNKKY